MKRLIVSEHARFEARRRDIAEDELHRVALAPEQVVPSRLGRVIHQSRVGGGRSLLRVVIEERDDDLFVVTVYKTSKVEKYWQPEVEP